MPQREHVSAPPGSPGYIFFSFQPTYFVYRPYYCLVLISLRTQALTATLSCPGLVWFGLCRRPCSAGVVHLPRDIRHGRISRHLQVCGL